MPIEFRCTQCGKLLRTPEGTGGQQAKCPACGAVVAVPETSQPPMPSLGPGGRDPFGAASDYGDASDSMNPYQAPAEISGGISPFQPVFAAGGVRPTRIEFSEVLSQTWRIFTEHWGMCLGVAVVCFIINFAAGHWARFS